MSCDAEDKSITTDRLRHSILIAYHTDDPLLAMTTKSQLSISRHSHQQRKDINLFFDEDLFMSQTEEEQHIDYVMDDLILRQGDGNTQYWYANPFGTSRLQTHSDTHDS